LNKFEAKLLDDNVTVKAKLLIVYRQATLVIATSEVGQVDLFGCSCKQTEEAALKRNGRDRQVGADHSSFKPHPQVRDLKADQKSTSTPCRRTNSTSLAPDKHVQQASPDVVSLYIHDHLFD